MYKKRDLFLAKLNNKTKNEEESLINCYGLFIIILF